MTNIKEKMTTKNIKFALFGALITAMILPFSGMGFADATPNENAKSLKQQYDEVSQQYRNAEIAIQKLDAIESERALTAGEQVERIQKISEMKALEFQAAEIQRQNIEAHKMPTNIAEKLDVAEKLVEANIKGLSGAYVNGKERTLKVIVSTQEEADKVQDLVGYIADGETNLEVRVSEFTFSGCEAQDDECNPVMGRIQIDGSGNNPCRLAVPYSMGSSEGFLTAGHCVDDSGFVYQPLQFANSIGNAADVDSEVQVSGSCDCAWVEKRGTKTFEERIFDTGYTWGYSWYAIDDHNTPTAGTFVSMGEKNGIVHSVEIEKYDDATVEGVNFTDMMYLDEGTSSGDSGGPVFGNISHDFHGIISGGDSSTTVASHWDNIETDLGL